MPNVYFKTAARPHEDSAAASQVGGTRLGDIPAVAERLNGRKISDETLQPGRRGTRRGDTESAHQAGIGVGVVVLVLCVCVEICCVNAANAVAFLVSTSLFLFVLMLLFGFAGCVYQALILCLLLLLMLPLLENLVLF